MRSMLASSAARSAALARSQASRTTRSWMCTRASVSSATVIEPRLYMSRTTSFMRPASPSLMNAPPFTPFCSRRMPAISRLRSASRSALRPTPSCCASSRSAGSLSPGFSAPLLSWSRMRWQISSNARRVWIGSKCTTVAKSSAMLWRLLAVSALCTRACASRRTSARLPCGLRSGRSPSQARRRCRESG